MRWPPTMMVCDAEKGGNPTESYIKVSIIVGFGVMPASISFYYASRKRSGTLRGRFVAIRVVDNGLFSLRVVPL